MDADRNPSVDRELVLSAGVVTDRTFSNCVPQKGGALIGHAHRFSNVSFGSSCLHNRPTSDETEPDQSDVSPAHADKDDNDAYNPRKT